MEKSAASFQDPIELAIVRGAIEMPGQVEHGGIVNDAIKRRVLKLFDDVKTISDALCDVGRAEKLLGPGIEPT